MSARRVSTVAVLVTVALTVQVDCRSSAPKQPPAASGNGAAADAGPPVGTPVHVAAVEKRTLTVVVTGPGFTDALEQQKVRAPFKGKLVRLVVSDGDVLRTGERIGEVALQESEAAVLGALVMLRSATTPAARKDAARALELAKKSLVLAPLTAPEAAIVVSHAADEGSLVAEGQDIVSLAALDSFFFRADISQPDLARVRPNQRATVRLAARPEPLEGKVEGVLPSATPPPDLRARVRVDVDLGPTPALGLFGTAEITVDELRDATTVPDAAVLKDDVFGTQRIAVVTGDVVHWLDVRTGVQSGGWTQITAPVLGPGALVITQGQVGLADGARVEVSQ